MELKGTFEDETGQVWRVTMTPDDQPPEAEGPTPIRRARITQYTRQLLLTHQDHRCALCKGPLALHDAHVDHIMPVAKGGTDDFSNLQITHMNCNLRKGRKVVEPERMPWAA